MLLTGLLVEYIAVKKGATWDLELKPEFLSQANTFVTAILHELFWLFYCVQWSYRFNIFPKQCHRDKTYSWDGFFGLRLVVCFFGFVCCFLGFFLRLANVNSAVLFISCSLNQVRMKVVSWFLNNISVMANQWIIESKYNFHLLLLNTYAAVSPSLPSHESLPSYVGDMGHSSSWATCAHHLVLRAAPHGRQHCTACTESRWSTHLPSPSSSPLQVSLLWWIFLFLLS